MDSKETLTKLLSGQLSEEEAVSEFEGRQSYIVWDGYFEDVYGVKHKDTGQKQHKGHTLIRFGDNSIREEDE